jgi:hypothetical protein
MGEEPSDRLREAEGSLMDSREKQFLNAEEVEANPAILRHPDARQKCSNRSGQAAGISKEHIPGPFSWRLVEMQKSPAYRVLSLSARKILDRLEIELAQHGFKPEENGFLPCTFEQFVEYGVERGAIAPGIREVVALGFVQVTRKGSAGNAEHRQPTLFLLTYRPFGSHKYVGNGWRRIGDIGEAEAIATAARSRTADARARNLGRNGGLASHAKKQNPGMGKPTDVGRENRPDNSAFRSGKPTDRGQILGRENRPPLEFSGGGSPGCTETATLPPPLARLPWSPRRTRELEPIGGWWPPASDDAAHIERPNHGPRTQLTRNQFR